MKYFRYITHSNTTVVLTTIFLQFGNNAYQFTCCSADHCMQESGKDSKSQTQCWPKDWLPEDVPNLRIIGVNYSTNISMWTPLCPIEGIR